MATIICFMEHTIQHFESDVKLGPIPESIARLQIDLKPVNGYAYLYPNKFSGALYHVTSRGDRRESINEDDTEVFRMIYSWIL